MENAIVHAFEADNNNKRVLIEFTIINSEILEVAIEDNGLGINKTINDVTKLHRPSFGLRNIKERLALIFPDETTEDLFKVTDLSDNGTTGTRVSILMPIINKNIQV